MSSHLAIYRRELSAYFTSPIGYIFLATFVIFTNLLALFVIPPGFFEYPLADMRVYFHVLAGVSAFLVAAVTMRLWAEEKKGNTFELLLTLPSREGALVAGKFLAAITFYAAGLVLTLSVPLMLMVLSRTARTASQWYGLLDPGTTLAGYLGCLLLGATFIAFGIFVSGLCADQIIAFVLTAPLLFLAYLMGLPWMEQAIDQAMSFLGPGLGEALGNYIGVFTHFNNLSRGLVDIGDILFFLVWTGIFLILNALHLERRGRQSGKTTFYLSFLVLFALGASLNWLFVEISFPRFDLTADRVFTVSEISGRVLQKTPEKIRLRYHVTPRDQMPPNLQDLERMVRDQLDTLVHA
ncbi:MAG: hypothetical protein LBU79_08965, partial [Planctomycetota bacterium]|nr:hypothetical protein [Planctomycetota bacterium]